MAELAERYWIGAKDQACAVEKHRLDSDPRGILWMFEPPNPRGNYVMGVDPANGIVNWDRTLRTQDDSKVDNSCIEVIKVGRGEPGDVDFIPDRQVAEYASPIDAITLGDVANVTGRLYAGTNEDGQCLCIIETQPGPGLLTLRRMMEKHGYTNQYVWRSQWDALVAKASVYYGWYASNRTVRDLWVRCSRLIQKHGLIYKSPWLIEEWADCEIDPSKQAAKAVYGSHDDRVRAMNLALWAAHDWGFEVETEKVEVNEGQPYVDWQRSDMTAEALYEAWDERMAEILES